MLSTKIKAGVAVNSQISSSHCMKQIQKPALHTSCLSFRKTGFVSNSLRYIYYSEVSSVI